LLLFFIEASSYIDAEDLKWQCYLMFAEDDDSESFVGYTTLYPFLYFPDKIRMRLSQFLILPPYLRLGLGSQLYKQVYESILASDEIMELTVEDPSPEFAAFRLSNDLPVFQAASDRSQKALKFSEPEYEMVQQLDEFIKLDYKEPKKFRLKVKKALWRRNRDTLPSEGDATFKEALAELYEERLDLFKNVLKL
jgi:histone acetyltransferase 1